MSIEFKNVYKSFGLKKILDGISFTVNTSDILFILGRSGMGKSVTLKCIVGLLKPEHGEITIHHQPIHLLQESQLTQIRQMCGMVFQYPALLDSLTIYDNIAFGLRLLSKDQIKTRVLECLKLVGLEESVLFLKPSEISYGMQKRVSIARTLAPGPRYLLFDEPTTALDPVSTNSINELIFELSRKLKVTSIVVSHDMGCALRIADQILVLDNAKVLANGSVEEIKHHHSPLIQDFLKEAI